MAIELGKKYYLYTINEFIGGPLDISGKGKSPAIKLKSEGLFWRFSVCPKLCIATYHSYYNALRIKNIVMKLSDRYQCRMYGCYQAAIPWRPYLSFFYRNK